MAVYCEVKVWFLNTVLNMLGPFSLFIGEGHDDGCHVDDMYIKYCKKEEQFFNFVYKQMLAYFLFVFQEEIMASYESLNFDYAA